MSRLHWFEFQAAGRIAIMARPRADDRLESEIGAWKSAGVDVVVSLLERGRFRSLDCSARPGFAPPSGSSSFRPDPGSRIATATRGGFADRTAPGRRTAKRSFRRNPLPRGDRSIFGHCRLRADLFWNGGGGSACVDQGCARLDRTGHRRATRLGDGFRQPQRPASGVS
jgi:hypothetical protein